MPGGAACISIIRQTEVIDVTILRIGPNKKYSDGWAAAFAGKKGAARPSAKKKTAPKRAKKAKK
jgi:hypothetical protein